MKALVVYDSQFRNTQKIAEAIAETIGGKAIRVTDFKHEMLKDLQILIVGSPIQGWRPMLSIENFLDALPAKSLTGIKTAAFDTRIKIFFSGDASKSVNAKLIKAGGTAVLAPGKFYVKGKEGPLVAGEIENALEWVRGTHE
jgi:flavodoxin